MSQYKIEIQGAEEFEALRDKVGHKAGELSDEMRELSRIVSNLRFSGVLDIGEKRTERPCWNSVDLGLPEENKAVIICRMTTLGNLQSGVGYHIGGVWTVFGSSAKCVEYWMNLPEPPADAHLEDGEHTVKR